MIFASWFTYDVIGKAWWLSMTASKTGDRTYTGALVQTSGPPFNAQPYDPGKVTRTTAGTGTLTLSDDDSGTFTYTVNGVQQSKSITRTAFGTLAMCTYTAQPDFASATNYQDLWWAAGEPNRAGG